MPKSGKDVGPDQIMPSTRGDGNSPNHNGAVQKSEDQPDSKKGRMTYLVHDPGDDNSHIIDLFNNIKDIEEYEATREISADEIKETVRIRRFKPLSKQLKSMVESIITRKIGTNPIPSKLPSNK